jgi:hypothetical protein
VPIVPAPGSNATNSRGNSSSGNLGKLSALSISAPSDNTQMFVFAVSAIGGAALLVVVVLVMIVLYRKFAKWLRTKRLEQLEAAQAATAEAEVVDGKKAKKKTASTKKAVPKCIAQLTADVSSDEEETTVVTLDRQKKARDRKMSVHDIEILMPGDDGDWTLLVEQDEATIAADDSATRHRNHEEEGLRFDDAYDHTAAMLFKGGFAITMNTKTTDDLEFEDVGGGSLLTAAMVEPFSDGPGVTVVNEDNVVSDHAYALTKLRKKSFVFSSPEPIEKKVKKRQDVLELVNAFSDDDDVDFDWKEDHVAHTAVVHVAPPCQATFTNLKSVMDDESPSERPHQEEPGRLSVPSAVVPPDPPSAAPPRSLPEAVTLNPPPSPGNIAFATPRFGTFDLAPAFVPPSASPLAAPQQQPMPSITAPAAVSKSAKQETSAASLSKASAAAKASPPAKADPPLLGVAKVVPSGGLNIAIPVPSPVARSLPAAQTRTEAVTLNPPPSPGDIAFATPRLGTFDLGPAVVRQPASSFQALSAPHELPLAAQTDAVKSTEGSKPSLANVFAAGARWHGSTTAASSNPAAPSNTRPALASVTRPLAGVKAAVSAPAANLGAPEAQPESLSSVSAKNPSSDVSVATDKNLQPASNVLTPRFHLYEAAPVFQLHEVVSSARSHSSAATDDDGADWNLIGPPPGTDLHGLLWSPEVALPGSTAVVLAAAHPAADLTLDHTSSTTSSSCGAQAAAPVPPPVDLKGSQYADLTRRQAAAVQAERMLQFAGRAAVAQPSVAQAPPLAPARPSTTTAETTVPTFRSENMQHPRAGTAGGVGQLDAAGPTSTAAPLRFFSDDDVGQPQFASHGDDGDEDVEFSFS